MTQSLTAFLTACVLSVVLNVSFAVAQENRPSFDCAKAETTVEEIVCNDPALTTLDRRLAARFKAALAASGGLTAGASEATNKLRSEQRGWIKGRDDCWKAPDVATCVRASYLTRESELVAMWMLEEPAARGRFVCGDALTQEIFVFFFDTQLPSVRAEFGDSIKPGWAVEAASGSKYEFAFGGFFWEKGDTALLSLSDGNEVSCVKAQ